MAFTPLNPIEILPGVDKDRTALSTNHYTDSVGIRFYQDFPQKIGGCIKISFDGNATMRGCLRNIYSQRIQNNIWTMYGTNTNLYTSQGSILTNITPLATATTAIANSLTTHYTTLAINPITTVINSTIVTFTHTLHSLAAGDRITISGATAVNGVPAGDINNVNVVRTVTANSYTIFVATAATSSGTGGGAAVIEATRILTITQAAHGLANDDRIKILAAAATGGIPAGDINIEHIIRAVTTNTYDIVVTTYATSAVSGGGGAATTRQIGIAEGVCDAQLGVGYGMGKYGVGNYGVAKFSSTPQQYPRIFSFDAFGNNALLTAGGQTGLYQWTGNTSIAPTLLTNAPVAVNYVFVTNNIVVALGSGGVQNRVQWSDQGNSTIWASTSQNQAGEDDVEGSGEFISHANVRGTDILFTADQVYTMDYIGKPFVFRIEKLDNKGLIARNARIVVDGILYWMSENDIYTYNGGTIQSIQSNAQNGLNYLKNFINTDINKTQQSKCFAGYNPVFNEIWFHYPSGTNLECNKAIIYNTRERHLTIHTINRSAFEYPNILDQLPKLGDSLGAIYRHEIGVNDDINPLAFSLTSNLFQHGNALTEIRGLIPDSVQTGNIQLDVKTRLYPQSTNIVTTSTTVTATTEKVDILTNGRNYQYTVSQNVLDGNWRSGVWQTYEDGGTPQ